MHCQRRILSVKWYDRVRNTEVSSLTGLESMSTIISRRRSSLFGHVVRLATDTPTNRALSLTVDVRHGSRLSRCWKRPRGRPRDGWLTQLTQDGSSIDELWAAADDMGYSRLAQRSSRARRSWWWYQFTQSFTSTPPLPPSPIVFICIYWETSCSS